MTQTTSQALGFLTVISDGAAHSGGYLITNLWGRPLEFRLTSAVQPNKVQQILYGPTLGIYLGAELIGKTLFEKANTPVGVVLTDSRDVLEIRRSLSVPVVWVAPAGNPEAMRLSSQGLTVRDNALVHPEYPDDVAATAETIARIGSLNLFEPFDRIREAIAEARKMGVSQRAAG